MRSTLSSPRICLLTLGLAACFAPELSAQTTPATTPQTYEAFIASADPAARFIINNLWMMLCAALVFVMHLGFSTLESGLTQSKNTVNILFKNLFILVIGVLTYAVWGFGAMYPGWHALNGGCNPHGFFAVGKLLSTPENVFTSMTPAYGAQYTFWSDFLFQAMFAATAATIVSGAVAERIKLSSFMLYATVLVMFAYPLTGSWQWGYGWLYAKGFKDFAGSTLVHAFGGFSALAAVLVLGPRRGKFLSGGKIRPIMGHSMPLAAIGVFMLFLGWFGFNGGSVLSADPKTVSFVLVTTVLSACSGCAAAIATSWVLIKKPDFTMALNGVLAGLVSITAGADAVCLWGAPMIGAIAGVLVVLACLVLDKVKIDDPVGAIPVHAVCGVWGTVAVALFQQPDRHYSVLIQLMGTCCVALFAFGFSFAAFSLLKLTLGVRVSEDEESEGLDIGEHGQEAYPNFQSQRGH